MSIPFLKKFQIIFFEARKDVSKVQNATYYIIHASRAPENIFEIIENLDILNLFLLTMRDFYARITTYRIGTEKIIFLER